MIRVIIRIDIDQIVEIGEHHLQVELSMDRILGEGCNMLIIIEMTLGEIIEVNILDVDIEVIIERNTLVEVELDLEKDNIQTIL